MTAWRRDAPENDDPVLLLLDGDVATAFRRGNEWVVFNIERKSASYSRTRPGAGCRTQRRAVLRNKLRSISEAEPLSTARCSQRQPGRVSQLNM